MLTAAVVLALRTTYYADPTGGDDGASGASPRSAWRSLEPAAKVRFVECDRLLICGGSKVAGPLRIKAPNGLTITSYGTGRATVDGGSGDGIVVEGGKALRIENLTLIADGRKANDGRGIALIETQDSRLVNLDVSGFRVSGVEALGCVGTLLSHVLAHENGSSGIAVSGGSHGVRSKDVTIRDCRALNNPGDPKNLTNHSGNGIVVGGVDGCLIEYCEAANNGWDMPRDGNGPVGIWAWNASRVTIQRCISHDNKSPGTDGGGFDLDGGVTDSLVQDNLSYGNAGVGYLLCQYPGGGEWRDNVFRNNDSFEDGKKNFHSGFALFVPPGMTNMANALVERNTIVNARFAVSTMGDIPRVEYRGNVLVSGEDALNVAWGQGGYRKSKFVGNLAWSKSSAEPFRGKDSPFATVEEWRSAGGLHADPRLRMPLLADLPTDPRKLSNLPWFNPEEGSPCLVGGKIAYVASLGQR